MLLDQAALWLWVNLKWVMPKLPNIQFQQNIYSEGEQASSLFFSIL